MCNATNVKQKDFNNRLKSKKEKRFAKQFASKKDVLTTHSQEPNQITSQVTNMGRNKKYRIKSINFGEEGNPSRSLLEKYEQLHGKQKTSEMVRKAIFVFLADRPELKGWKEKNLRNEKKQLAIELRELSRRMQDVHKRAEEMGIDLDE